MSNETHRGFGDPKEATLAFAEELVAEASTGEWAPLDQSIREADDALHTEQVRALHRRIRGGWQPPGLSAMSEERWQKWCAELTEDQLVRATVSVAIMLTTWMLDSVCIREAGSWSKAQSWLRCQEHRPMLELRPSPRSVLEREARHNTEGLLRLDSARIGLQLALRDRMDLVGAEAIWCAIAHHVREIADGQALLPGIGTSLRNGALELFLRPKDADV